MDKENLSQNEIEKKAFNRAEANVYSLNNSYLNIAEKREVELWFQLPGEIMFYTIIIASIYSVYNPLSLMKILVISILINIVVGILNWYFYNKKLTLFLYLTIFHSYILYLVGIIAGIFLFFKGLIILGIISILYPFGPLSFIELHMLAYSILAKKYRMHPKFAFFKKEYGKSFPFEED